MVRRLVMTCTPVALRARPIQPEPCAASCAEAGCLFFMPKRPHINADVLWRPLPSVPLPSIRLVDVLGELAPPRECSLGRGDCFGEVLRGLTALRLLRRDVCLIPERRRHRRTPFARIWLRQGARPAAETPTWLKNYLIGHLHSLCHRLALFP